MNNIGEKYLPIGTVVMLKGASKRLMITGFCSMDEADQDVMYDYAGCMYPEGFLSSDQTALFNHDQIEKVYHMGLVDEEEKQFKENLKGVLTASTAENGNEPSGFETIAPAESAVEAPAAPATTDVETKVSEDGQTILIPPVGDEPVASEPAATVSKVAEDGQTILIPPVE